MKQLFITFLLMTFLGCASLKRVAYQDSQFEQLKENHGILALSVRTMDKINHISIVSSVAGQDFNIDFPAIGNNLFLFEVPEGEYCIQRIHLARGTLVFRGASSEASRGICTLVEADTVNYSGEIFLSNPPRVISNYPYFVRQLKQNYPSTCKQYIGEGCE